MKIIKSGPKWFLLRATFGLVRKSLANPANHLHTDGGENCLFSFAKAYYKGGGIWQISGYSHDGSDVKRVIDKMTLDSNGMVSASA